MNCPFCEKPEIKERTIIENNFAFAFPALMSIVPWHILICPKRCVKDFYDLTEEERQSIFEIMQTITKALKELVWAEWFNYARNEWDMAWQSVPHFHLHVLPRKTWDTWITEYEPRKFLYRPGSRAESPQEELLEISRQLQKIIKDSK